MDHSCSLHKEFSHYLIVEGKLPACKLGKSCPGFFLQNNASLDLQINFEALAIASSLHPDLDSHQNPNTSILRVFS
jgi:hypothetical protein